MENKNLFDNFTKQYALSKTLETEKYKTTKTIRFKLEPINVEALESETKKLQHETPYNLNPLILGGFEIIKLFEQFIFQDEQKKRLKMDVTIHYRWLRQYTKNAFYNWKDQNTKKTEKKIKIRDVSYLREIVAAFTEEWRNTIEQLNIAQSKPDESKTRKADIALQVKKLGTRQIFPFLKNFIESANDKKSDDLKNRLLDETGRFQANLLTCEKYYLPAQSSGIVLARASFNYYTTNKKTKDFDKEAEEVNNQLTAKFKLQQDQSQLLRELNINNLIDMPLDKLYEKLKAYKSEQKKLFQEAVSKGLEHKHLKENFPLFHTRQGIFDDFCKKTKQITEKSTQISKIGKGSKEAQTLQKEIDKIKRERGTFFQKKFCTYINLCKLYKNVAVEKGKLNAQFKGIEKERFDSQRLEYWAAILKKDGHHQLALISKEKAQAVYQKLKSDNTAASDQQPVLYYFESMTYRALRKLCFGVNENTFLPEIKKELPKYNQGDFGEFRFKKENDEQDEAGLIKFYQEVLQTRFVQENLALPQVVFNEVANQQFSSLNDFKIALEKTCYVRHKIVHSNFIDELTREYDAQVFKITSHDLQKKEEKGLKAHTRLWLDFWEEENEKEHFNLRLNPEISITWREAKKSRIEKYDKGAERYDPLKKNRYLYPQFTLTTSFNVNALSNEISYAFEDVKKKGEAVIKFNDKINKTLKEKLDLDKENLWFYGIDTGEIELATLSLIGKDKKPFRFPVISVKEGKLGFSKYGYIYKDGKHIQRDRPHLALANLSYFLNDELYEKTFRDKNFEQTYKEIFEEKEVSVIDLTTAKLISGKIVLNGDLTTFLNLKILHAKRKIYQELINDPQAQLEVKDFKIYINKHPIYHSREVFERIKRFVDIQKELTSYFESRQKDTARVEDNINKTRRAITANMTGVVFHLYQQYPGIISIENLSANKVESDRKKFEGNVERPLEWALYRKFQYQGLTPPISELIALREMEKFPVQNARPLKSEHIKQFGIINFVSEEDTSKICPNCGKKAYKGDHAGKYQTDKQKKIFACEHCRFHNMENPMRLDDLDTNDKIAAYNIARRGLEELFKSAANQ